MTRIYYSVPNYTGYGPTFETAEEALSCALGKVQNARLSNETSGTFIPLRATIVEREADERGDREVRRYTLGEGILTPHTEEATT
jgi:hypothetical protein